MARNHYRESFKAGAGLIKSRAGLAVLLYTVNVVIALVLALPLYLAVIDQIGGTGVGEELLRGFELVRWREMAKRLVETMAGLGLQFLLVLPVYMLWKVAARMGVIYALHQGALWPFWRGVGYYTGRGLLVALLYLPLKICWSVGVVFLGGLLFSVQGGEVGGFWIWAAVVPMLLIAGFAILDLFQRYSAIALVVRHDGVGRAIKTGMSWPIKYGAASYLYLTWFAITLLVTVFIFVLNAMLHVGVSMIALGFLIQQVALFSRAAITVGWTGSEVTLFERTYIDELPLIADVEVSDDAGDTHLT